MGSMGKGGGFGGSGMPDMGKNKGSLDDRETLNGTTSEGTKNPTRSDTDESKSLGLNVQGTSASTIEGETSEMPGGFNGSYSGQSSDEADTTLSDNPDSTDSSENKNRPSRDNMQIPGGHYNFNINGKSNTASSSANWIWLAVSVLILGAGIIIAKVYKN